MKKPSSFPSLRPIMRVLVTVSLLALNPAFQVLVAAEAAEQGVVVGDLTISAPWARAMLPGQPTGGGYFTIENMGSTADKLTAATSPSAELVEIHQMSMESNVMKMRQIIDGLEIPAGGKVEFAPGGLHLMFKKVKSPFAVGDTIKVTLNFEKSGAVDVNMPVGTSNPN